MTIIPLFTANLYIWYVSRTRITVLFRLSVSPQSIWICSVKIEISEIYTGLKFPREPMFPWNAFHQSCSFCCHYQCCDLRRDCVFESLHVKRWQKKGQPEGARKRAWRGLVRSRKVGEIQIDWQKRQEKRAETSRGRQILTEGAAQRNLLHTCTHGHTQAFASWWCGIWLPLGGSTHMHTNKCSALR